MKVPVAASHILVRTSKKDSAFLYNVLEAHEGLTAYSTVEGQGSGSFRDVMLIIPPGSELAVRKLLQDLESFVVIVSAPSL